MAKNFALRLVSLALVLTCIFALCTSTALADDFYPKKTSNDSCRIVILGLEDDEFKTYSRMLRDKSPDDISISITCDPEYNRSFGNQSWFIVCNNDDGEGEYIFEDEFPKNIVFVNSFFANASLSEHEEEEYYQYENRLARHWVWNLTELARNGATIHLYVSESNQFADIITRVAIAYLDMYSRAGFNIEKYYNVFKVSGLTNEGYIIVHRIDDENEALHTAITDILRTLWTE